MTLSAFLRQTTRALLAVGFLGAVLHQTACEGIAGIVDRHLEVTGDSGAADSPECVEYCDTVMEACVSPYTVYPSKVVCLDVCKHLEPGDPATHKGNTVACRAFQARNARNSGELDNICPAAGPGGAGVCGDDCESYCTLYAAVCPKDSSVDCVKKCATLLDDGTFDAVKNHDGDTLQCRLVHASNSTFDATGHCWHASLAPRAGSPCAIPTPNCDDYCRVLMSACTGEDAMYESKEQCMSSCAKFPNVGKSSDAVEDTLGCRTYHSYNALDIGPDHCHHAGPGGDGHCGTGNCTPYCEFLEAVCPTEFAALGTAKCEEECGKLADAGKDSKPNVASGKSGTDSVECRTLHVQRASEGGAAAAAECQAAVSGDPCK